MQSFSTFDKIFYSCYHNTPETTQNRAQATTAATSKYYLSCATSWGCWCTLQKLSTSAEIFSTPTEGKTEACALTTARTDPNDAATDATQIGTPLEGPKHGSKTVTIWKGSRTIY